MAETSTDTTPLTLEVMRAGRRFPGFPAPPNRGTPNRVRELQIQPSEESLPQRLSRAIWQRLPWRDLQSGDYLNRDPLVSAWLRKNGQLNSIIPT